MPTIILSRTSQVVAKRSFLLRAGALLPRAWHLLSLDAPTVAATWCVAFLRAAGLGMANHAARCPALFLSLATWFCYVGDRTLDARASLLGQRVRERHRFYGSLWANHRRWLLAALCCAGLACSATAVFGLTTSLFLSYVVLTVVALFYFTWVHSGGEGKARAFAKEASVGLIFAFGCVLPTWDITPIALRAQLILAGGLFAVLCWLNCVAIEHWERRGNIAGHVHWSTRWAARHLGPLLGGASLAAAALALLGGAGGWGPLAWCLASAFLLLGTLEWLRRRLSVAALRILADIALLTPLAWWVVSGASR